MFCVCRHAAYDIFHFGLQQVRARAAASGARDRKKSKMGHFLCIVSQAYPADRCGTHIWTFAASVFDRVFLHAGQRVFLHAGIPNTAKEETGENIVTAAKMLHVAESRGPA
jgi:hypothetical protein